MAFTYAGQSGAVQMLTVIQARSVDLSTMSFDDEDLTGIDFGTARLHGTSFRRAVLSRANLADTSGLTPAQLAGADLFATKLPENFCFPACQTAEQLASRAEKLLVALIAACATSLVYLGTVRTPDLFFGTTSIKLPVLGLPLSTTAYFALSPVLLIALYSSLCFTNWKLALSLSDLPARFPDGRTLDQQFIAFTPNIAVLACYHWEHLRRSRSSGVASEWWSVLLLIWWTAPLTIVYLWAIHLQTHESLLIAEHVVCIVAAAWIGRASYRVVAGTLGAHRQRKQSRLRRQHSNYLAWPAYGALTTSKRRKSRLRSRPAGSSIGLAVLIGLFVGIASVVAIELRDERAISRLFHCPQGSCLGLADADLGDAQLKGLYGNGKNLRRANLYRASLQNSKALEVLFEGADLRAANMTHANFGRARFHRALLADAILDSAQFHQASFAGADLSGASLRGTELLGADLRGARLVQADLTGALVCGARLTFDAFTFQQLQHVRGVHFADVVIPEDRRKVLPPPEPLDSLFSGRMLVEARRWQAAWRKLRTPLTLEAGARISQPFTMSVIYESEVSMDQGIQNLKDNLLQELGSEHADSRGFITLTQGMIDDYVAFRDGVRHQLRSHCASEDDVPG